MQETVLERERRAEECTAVFLACMGPSHIDEKISDLWSAWVKSDECPTMEELSLCICILYHLDKFKEYVLRTEETNFSDVDLTVFLCEKVFEAKGVLGSMGKPGFVSTLGCVHHYTATRVRWSIQEINDLH